MGKVRAGDALKRLDEEEVPFGGRSVVVFGKRKVFEAG